MLKNPLKICQSGCGFRKRPTSGPCISIHTIAVVLVGTNYEGVSRTTEDDLTWACKFQNNNTDRKFGSLHWWFVGTGQPSRLCGGGAGIVGIIGTVIRHFLPIHLAQQIILKGAPHKKLGSSGLSSGISSRSTWHSR